MNCRKRKQQLMETYLNGIESREQYRNHLQQVIDYFTGVMERLESKIKAKKSLDNA